MKYKTYDPETNTEYECENEYEFKIKSFITKTQEDFFDDKVIEYIISLKNQLIDELDKNSSNSDKIRLKHIKWIEKSLEGIHDFIIQYKLPIPKILEEQKTFIYRTSKRQTGRPKGTKNKLTTKKHIWIRDKYLLLKKKRMAHTIEESARLIRSQLLKEKPEFWDEHIYPLATIIDIIKKQKWGD